MDFKEFKERFEKVPVQIINDLPQEKPLVTICIQTYNQVKFIEECIQGVLIQKTDFPIEILLADDDSEDGTREICLKYTEQNPHLIRLFLHSRKNNIKVGGVPSANFIALYNFFSAKGKYIAICEGDDIWSDPLKLQKQYNFMESNPLYSICYHDYQTINSSGEISESDKVSPLRKDLNTTDLVLSFIHPATLTVFFKSGIKRKIPDEITKVLALDVFLYSLLGQFGPGKYLNDIKPALYRVHNGGVWTEMELEPKLMSKINTFNQLSRYYSIIGREKIARLFRKRNKKIKQYLVFLSVKNFQPKLLVWTIKNW